MLTEQEVEYALDACKSKAFLGNNAAFLGSLLCSMEIIWSDVDNPTAKTNGLKLWWNKDWFISLPKETRVTVLVHELWHPGRLHFVRCGNRDKKIWNYACMPRDSLIAMADGSSKSIAWVQPGDLIKNVKDGTSSVAARINSGIKDILEFTYESGRILKCTPEHKVLTDYGFQNAAQLTTGTTCFVDTRFDQNSKGALGNQANSGNSRLTGHEVSTSGDESLHSRLDQIREALVSNDSNADLESTRMGLSCRFDRWGRDDHHHSKDGKRKTVPTTEDARNQHLSVNEGLVSKTGIRLDTSGEQQGVLVLHHDHSSDPLEGIVGATASMVGHQAALSNIRASLDGSTESASLQVYLDARNGKDSREHLYLEHDRIVQIRQLPAEETFDLVTSDHHFIANGVVVHNCDIRINNDLKEQGYSFKDIEWAWLMPELDDKGKMAEEDIYDYLMQNQLQPPPQPGGGDTTGLPKDDDSTSGEGASANQVKMLEAVIRAVQAAERSNQAGSIPGGTKAMITQFLTPKIPWEAELMQFFTDMSDYRYTWARPNRRFQDDYRQSTEHECDRLDHLVYFLDVSGSIEARDRLRFNSEVKYIKDVLNPRKLTLVQFDTEIQHEHVFEESDPFEKVVDVSGGGTCLVCVHDWIIKHNPTAAIIFSDMHVSPMTKPKNGCPVIWVRIGNGHVPSFGKVINIRS